MTTLLIQTESIPLNALTEQQKASFAPICSDFVIELCSASDRLTTLQDKLQEYMANGAGLGLQACT